MAKVITGIEVLLKSRLELLSGERVGAVVHPASVLSNLRHTADALFSEKSLQLVSLFGPQHGARGEKQDNMIESQFYLDPETGLPVHSLYGTTRQPTEAMMQDIDVLVFDLQDVGTRVYTFIHTMAHCMSACALYGKKMVVLDRPNPIAGLHVEGKILEEEFRSFVGLYPLPMRHGMTVGELALLFNSEFAIGCDLTIVEMDGWRRSSWFDQTGLPWVQPSPNMPSSESATVYPGTVLIEGTLLSEGRGTTRPFEFVGAPFIDAHRFARHLNSLSLSGVFFRPAYFQPTFQKWSGLMCGGVQIHVTDREVFEPCLAGVAIISAARELYSGSFEWRLPPYEYEYTKLPIDILAGGETLRSMIERGQPPDAIRRSWQDDEERFRELRRPYLLYD